MLVALQCSRQLTILTVFDLVPVFRARSEPVTPAWWSAKWHYCAQGVEAKVTEVHRSSQSICTVMVHRRERFAAVMIVGQHAIALPNAVPISLAGQLWCACARGRLAAGAVCWWQYFMK